MNALPPLISQEESDRKRNAPEEEKPEEKTTGSPPEADEPPRKKTRSNKAPNFTTPVKPKTSEDSKNDDKTKDSPGMKFVCKICSVCKRTKELIEKVHFLNMPPRTAPRYQYYMI